MKPLAFILPVALATLAPLHVEASLSSISTGPIVVVAAQEAKAVAVSLALPAELVSVPLHVVSEQKNAALAYEETQQAIEMIVRKAKESGRFRTTRGIVSLSQHRGGFGISSGSWSEPAAAAQLYLLVPLTKERPDLFGAGAEAARFVEGLRLPGRTRCDLGRLQLAVENPEQYRPRLLEFIAQEARSTRQLLAPGGTLQVQNLESPVRVRQMDDRNVELFIPYTLAITAEK